MGAGGVLIAVKNTLVASPVSDLDTDCEVTWIRVELSNSKPLFIGSFYRTPSSDDPEVINKLHESVSKLTCKDTALPNIILNGDFNTPDIIWENSSIRTNPNYSMSLNNSMLDFVSANFLTQMTNVPTRNDNILDLTLTTNPDLISDIEAHPGMSDHYAVTYKVNLTVKRQKKPDCYIFQYRKSDLEGVKQDLGAFLDRFFLSEDPLDRSVNDNWNLFKENLVNSMKKNIPQKKITSRWNLPWMTPEIKRLCRKKKRAWDDGKHNRNSHSWNRYLKLNKLVKQSIQESHRSYIDNILNNSINENPKKFYSYMKQKKAGQSNIPVLKSEDKLLSEPAEVAEALNSQYTSQFTREPNGHLPDIGSQPVSSMPDILFTVPGIEKLLNNLNPAKASGPDLVPARILKLASREIAPVLSVIFQQSYNTGQVPLDWQQANVTAVFKKGDKTNPANYRPVSLTCIVCKSMEHIIYSQIMKHLDTHNILVDFQHGFRANHSCETQLLNTVEDLSRRLDKRKTTDLLILDFSKAFDTVPHRRLLHKLQHYGVTGKNNKWIESWLCHRQQRVVLDGSASTDSPVLSGVPQGTVLGPLLFLLYVNDIGANVSFQTTIKLFADDCLLYRTIESAADEIQLQQDLTTMVEWSNTWLMRFNAAKCHLLRITRQRKLIPTKYNIQGVQLQEVDHHPYLGVEFSSDLTWKLHISNITSKANRILNLLRRHLYGCNQEVKSRAFTSLVRPHLEYSSSVWDPYYKQDIFALEKVQRKGARFVTGNYSYLESVTSMLQTLDWPPLQQRRQARRLTHFYKAANNLSPVRIPEYVTASSNRTRTHDLAFIQLHTNYEQYKHSFLPRTIREWNALPPDLVHAVSVDDFSSRLQCYTA
ncbi:MAG: reverse transcriptase family protein [Candidatus Thiodiazotropha sp.]